MAVRMYITTVFNREVNRSMDFVSVGGYEIEFKHHGSIRFDFNESCGHIDGNSVEWELRDLDTEAFPESEALQDCLLNDEIVRVLECYVYESSKSQPLQLTGLKDMGFWVCTESIGRDVVISDAMLESVEFD